jgi:single-strand DNA-binding protein
MSEIQIQATGHLTKDPEISYTTSGHRGPVPGRSHPPEEAGGPVGRRRDHLPPMRGVAELAEHVAESLSKGDQVFVSGVLRTQRWKDPQGADREKLVVNVDDVGPSLQWATARPQKAQRAERPAAPAQQAQADPWAASATQAVESQLGGRVVSSTGEPAF